MNDYYSMRRREIPKPEKTYEISDDPATLRQKTMLILEDDVAFAIQLKDALEIQGYVVTVVANGAEGLRRVEAFDALRVARLFLEAARASATGRSE